MALKNTYIRALELDDCRKINKWHNDESIFSTIMANKYFISYERDKRWIQKLIMEDKQMIFWAICLNETHEMIGFTSLIEIDLLNKKAKVGGLTIDPYYQNQKMGYDAFDQVLDYAFLELGLNKISAGYLDSQKITEKSLNRYGFITESRLRQEIYKLGRFHDVVVASLLANEYKSTNNS